MEGGKQHFLHDDNLVYLTQNDEDFIRFVIDKIPNKTPKWKVPQIIRKEIKDREQNERKKR